MKKTFFMITLFFGAALSASEPSYVSAELPENLREEVEQKKLWDHPYWHKLIHYEKRTFGQGVKSQADGSGFFFSPKGKTNPKLELFATLSALLKPSEPETPNFQPPRCRFPARLRWLEKNLTSFQYTHQAPQCERLERWKKALNAQKVYYVFAAFHLNNPSSMFGHTFLRFERNTFGLAPALDYVVNYAANTGDNPGPLYPVLGIMGGYPGAFSTFPNYVKDLEYLKRDRRDLWEYELDFSPDQIELMLHHLWEMGSTHFNYYFVDENCSYHLLALLEVGNPELKLKNQLPVFVVPTDTVKVVFNAPKFVKNITYKPSLRSQFLQKTNQMNEIEKQDLKKLIRPPYLKKEILEKHESDRQGLLLDALLDFEDLKNKNLDLGDKQKEILNLRAKIVDGVEVPNAPISTPAHLGHPVIRPFLGGGYEEHNKSFMEFSFLPAYQDLLSPDEGFPPLASMEVAFSKFRFYPQKEKFELKELTLIRILSFMPQSTFFRPLSWGLSFGYRQPGLYFEGGPGLAFELHKSVVLFFLGEAFVESAWWNDTRFRVGPKALGGVRVDLNEKLRWLSEVEFNYSPLGEPTQQWFVKSALRVALPKNMELRFEGKGSDDFWETGGHIGAYF